MAASPVLPKSFTCPNPPSPSDYGLENELDTRLFNRTTRGVTLTTEGSLLFEYAHSALSLIEAGEQKLTEFKDMAIGELKMESAIRSSKHFLLPYLEEFHIRYPNIRFKIVNGLTWKSVSCSSRGLSISGYAIFL